MSWPSALAIYLLIWVLSAFVVLPFGMRTSDEDGVPRVPGQADSAPAHVPFGRILIRMTIVSAIVFAVFYANYVNGWITTEAFRIIPR